jgi:hypothetical protein
MVARRGGRQAGLAIHRLTNLGVVLTALLVSSAFEPAEFMSPGRREAREQNGKE